MRNEMILTFQDEWKRSNVGRKLSTTTLASHCKVIIVVLLGMIVLLLILLLLLLQHIMIMIMDIPTTISFIIITIFFP